jgi:hypothetical protein
VGALDATPTSDEPELRIVVAATVSVTVSEAAGKAVLSARFEGTETVSADWPVLASDPPPLAWWFVDASVVGAVTFEPRVSGDAGDMMLATKQPSKIPAIVELSLGELSRVGCFSPEGPCLSLEGKFPVGAGVAPIARPSVTANESPKFGASLPGGDRKVVGVVEAAG